MKRWLNNKVPELWGKRSAITYALLPLSFGFRAISALRRYAYRHYFKADKLPVPVVIVGNISVGGTGKTPFVIWLVNALKSQGFSPGVVTRGYKGALTKKEVLLVTGDNNAYHVGDEAIVLAKNTQCPVVAGRKRIDAAKLLLKKHPEINVIISDDGLQHYALHRDVEIAIIDGKRQFGNGYCLPAGPLREPPSRLQSVDFIVNNGGKEATHWPMQTVLCDIVRQVNDPENKLPISHFAAKKVHAVAAIGSPERFFSALEAKNIQVLKHSFPDHYFFKKQDLNFTELYPILMTEKDAVKCRTIATENTWFISVDVSLPEEFIFHIIQRITNGQETSRHTSMPNLQTAGHL